MPDSIIRVQGLRKLFPTRRGWRAVLRAPGKLEWKTALDDVNLEVKEGEVFGLLGANGAGKTTLVRVLSTLLLPTAGRVEIAGYDVVKFPFEVRRIVGWSLETERSFYYRLTGLQNLSFFAALNNVNSGRTEARIKELVEIVGLGDEARRPFMNYSSGMRQKLGLARALLTNPPILLLDEPTKSLDPAATTELWHFLQNVLARELKKTILIVTHNLGEAEFCCDRVALMKGGQIASTGTWPEVKDYIHRRGFWDGEASSSE